MDREGGFIIITTMMLLVVLMTLLAAFYITTNIELATTRFSQDSTRGFYVAEAGLNLRAEEIRQIFIGYNRPTGVSPNSGAPACVGGNTGSGDYICKNYSINGRTARSYVVEDATNPVVLTIPAGERYQYLNAQEYRYTARSNGLSPSGKDEAQLELRFKSRLVPMFQFAAFYNKDLEILPGPVMTLSGPVHTNGDLYLNTDAGGNGLTIQGQVTTAGRLYRGRKNDSTCASNKVRVYNPLSAASLIPSCSTRRLLSTTDVTGWNGQIQMAVPVVTVPDPEVLDPTPGQVYWDHADLRLVLKMLNATTIDTTNSPSGIEVRRQDNTVDTYATTRLATCTGSVRQIGGSSALRATGTSAAFRNNREGRTIRMLDVDLRALFNCLHSNYWLTPGPVAPKRLDDSGDGGLVFYFTVSGPSGTTSSSPYGIRVRNGATLQATVAGAPLVRGLTVVTDQALYLQGDYNSAARIPAAALSDSFNVLSNAFYSAAAQNFTDSNSTLPLGNRTPTATTMNLALLAGTDTTGGAEGSGGQGGSYNGGLENYPRFHENWAGAVNFTYNGSFVSLNRPRRVSGAWVYGGSQYTAPVRAWGYDTSFNNAANLPPITPRFVYLRQELFVRDFDQ